MFAVGSTLTNSSEIRDNPYVKVALRMTKPYVENASIINSVLSYVAGLAGWSYISQNLYYC